MYLFIAIGLGFLFALFTPQIDLYGIFGIEMLLYLLLGIGLYGAVYGIELDEFHKHKMLIFKAVTFGVLLKSIVIGSLLYLLFQTPYAFLFGIIVAQIDPLSVAHLISGKEHKFSRSGTTILRAWSSFDDPMTVLLALYIYLPLALASSAFFTPESYGIQLIVNLGFAGILWFITKRIHAKQRLELSLLVLAFFIAVGFKLMLGIALAGLFLRPVLKKLSTIVFFAFLISAFLLGLLLKIEVTYLLYGIVLGILAIVGQILATFLIARKLVFSDKIFLAFAQYNGITSIILALVISQYVTATVSVIAIAVITINILYYCTNWMLEKKLLKTVEVLKG